MNGAVVVAGELSDSVAASHRGMPIEADRW